MAVNKYFDSNLQHLLTNEVCEFFLPAILLDTENLKTELKGKKWSEIDELACLRIFKILHSCMFNSLINKKTDRKLNLELGLELILRKDYKNYLWDNRIKAGISVIFNSFHEIMNSFSVDSLKSSLEKRANDNSLDVYMIITQVYDNKGNVTREFMIFCSDQARLDKLTYLFENRCPFGFSKKKFTGLTKHFSFFIFKDDSVSRKKVEPIFMDIFDGRLDK